MPGICRLFAMVIFVASPVSLAFADAQTPFVQTRSVAQSVGATQSFFAAHFAGQLPPQSTSVSSPSFVSFAHGLPGGAGLNVPPSA